MGNSESDQATLSRDLLNAAKRLHGFISTSHWNGTAVCGPDPGIRFNARIGRFIKSYTSFLPWRDNVSYMQAQGYWILNNWLMYDLFGDHRYREVAIACTDYVTRAQTPEGYWEYPNREWKGRIATVEGCFATLGLLETHARLPTGRYLEAARRWDSFLRTGMGFRRQDDDRMLAIKYFAHDPDSGGGVPNNSTLVLWTLARLSEVTDDPKYLEGCREMVTWLGHVQLSSGELPYALSDTTGNGRLHFLCYQYNAFEFMDLAHYHRMTGDDEVWPIMRRLACYLKNGQTPNGAARYDCHQVRPEVLYYSLAVAQALSQAQRMGLVDCQQDVERAYRNALSHQRADGSFAFHSRGNYRCLTDRRSYPRYLSMIQHHLLQEALARSDRRCCSGRELPVQCTTI